MVGAKTSKREGSLIANQSSTEAILKWLTCFSSEAGQREEQVTGKENFMIEGYYDHTKKNRANY